MVLRRVNAAVVCDAFLLNPFQPNRCPGTRCAVRNVAPAGVGFCRNGCIPGLYILTVFRQRPYTVTRYFIRPYSNLHRIGANPTEWIETEVKPNLTDPNQTKPNQPKRTETEPNQPKSDLNFRILARLPAPHDKPPYLCILIAPASRYVFHSFPIEETQADKAFMHVLEGIVMGVVTEGMGMIEEVCEERRVNEDWNPSWFACLDRYGLCRAVCCSDITPVSRGGATVRGIVHTPDGVDSLRCCGVGRIRRDRTAWPLRVSSNFFLCAGAVAAADLACPW